MNFNKHPHKEQLRTTLAVLDDARCHHLAWVSNDGELHIDAVPEDFMSRADAAVELPNMRFRLETFLCGAHYVGIAASQDGPWVDRLFGALTRFWHDGAEGYQDLF